MTAEDGRHPATSSLVRLQQAITHHNVISFPELAAAAGWREPGMTHKAEASRG